MRRVVVALAFVLAAAVLAAPARASFGLLPSPAGFSATVTEANGSPATLAGSHPYALTTKLAFNLAPSGYPEADVRNLLLELPPGMIEAAAAVPRCSQVDFHTPRVSPYEESRSGESCPEATQIGVVAVKSAAGSRHFGLFNLVPSPGDPSRFGFNAYGAPIIFTPQVRQAEGEYGITLASRDISQLFDLRALEMTVWGVPWDLDHDGQRGSCLNEQAPTSPHAQCPVPASQKDRPTRAYLTLPSSCTGPLAFSVAVVSWEAPGAWQRSEAETEGPEGCDQLDFFLQLSAQPDTQLVSSPTGLALKLETFQGGLALFSPGGRLQSQVKKVVMSLPEGMTINPSLGAGLSACSEDQFAAESTVSAPGAGCPNPSKIGLVTLETPLVEGSMQGSLFIATPHRNPFNSPYGFYFVARSAARGFLVKAAGKLDADPATGRLTATFDNLPQLPYANLKINFREGQRAPLVSPPTCSTYPISITGTAWSGLGTVQNSTFKLSRGVTGGSCPAGAAPFIPGAVAGTLNANAGSSTAFYLRLTRTDAEQEITSYSTQLPLGLLGRIAGVPYCPDASIETAKSRAGTAEAAAPSCPAASQIGHTYSGYGVGLAPAYSPGRYYLAGPYQGAPLSVVAINPALVGPFDLGTIVIRSAIRVDPRTARVTIDSAASDPIPHIFAGIPLHLRDIRVYIDRPGFMRNPTSCAPFSITSSLTGSALPFTNPRAISATATVPFQLSNCSSLEFKPRFALSAAGGTTRGDYPTLKAVVTPRSGDADIATAVVTLPPSLFLAQNNIGDVCTRLQSEADACPVASQIGRVRAETPLLDGPMEGPVYLRSSSNRLPDLVAVLHSRGVRIVLEGRVGSHRRRMRATFEGLPDAPVSKFTMTIFGGKKRGILVNSANLCAAPQVVAARLIGHSNVGRELTSRLGVRCARRGAKKRNSGQKGGDR